MGTIEVEKPIVMGLRSGILRVETGSNSTASTTFLDLAALTVSGVSGLLTVSGRTCQSNRFQFVARTPKAT